MRLLVNAQASGGPALAGAPRMRPTDRPQWFDASADHDHWATWRREADAAALPLDAFLTITLEASLTVSALGRLGITRPASLLAEAAARPAAIRRLRPPPPLAAWNDLL